MKTVWEKLIAGKQRDNFGQTSSWPSHLTAADSRWSLVTGFQPKRLVPRLLPGSLVEISGKLRHESRWYNLPLNSCLSTLLLFLVPLREMIVDFFSEHFRGRDNWYSLLSRQTSLWNWATNDWKGQWDLFWFLVLTFVS